MIGDSSDSKINPPKISGQPGSIGNIIPASPTTISIIPKKPKVTCFTRFIQVVTQDYTMCDIFFICDLEYTFQA